jgi:hypothetical protein
LPIAPRAAAVNTGRQATGGAGAESGVDGREHGAMLMASRATKADLDKTLR